jgi:hypothetical protein
MKKLLALSLFAVMASACARPDYVSASELNPNSKQDADCPYSLQNVQLCLTAAWEQTPDSTKYNSMKLTLSGANINAFDQLESLLWMPSMGHGSSPVRIEKIDANTYRIYDMYFVMAGDWEVRIFLKKAGQSVDQVFIPVRLK